MLALSEKSRTHLCLRAIRERDTVADTVKACLNAVLDTVTTAMRRKGHRARRQRRIERHLADAKLLPGKTLENFDFDAVPMVSKAQVSALCAGDGWLRNGANLILMGPPGGGKSHLSSAIGLSLVEKGWKVLFARTSDLVQRLQVARRELALESAINRLDRFDLLILDDLAYVTKDQAETSVLFELISARYERRSLLITANQPFGEWNKVFPDPAMTLAAVDRPVHHSTIFELNVESYRRRTALQRKQLGPGRPPTSPRRTMSACRRARRISDEQRLETDGPHARRRTHHASDTPVVRTAAQRQRAYRLRRKRAVIDAIGDEVTASRVTLLTLLGQELAGARYWDRRDAADRGQTPVRQAHLDGHRHALRDRPRRLRWAVLHPIWRVSEPRPLQRR
jgi:DNA replication protein DnaC